VRHKLNSRESLESTYSKCSTVTDVARIATCVEQCKAIVSIENERERERERLIHSFSLLIIDFSDEKCTIIHCYRLAHFFLFVWLLSIISIIVICSLLFFCSSVSLLFYSSLSFVSSLTSSYKRVDSQSVNQAEIFSRVTCSLIDLRMPVKAKAIKTTPNQHDANDAVNIHRH
jgi:hypothetical protein